MCNQSIFSMDIVLRALLAWILTRVDFITCLKEEEELVEKITRQYMFDFQVLVVERTSDMRDFFKRQVKSTQILTAESANRLIKSQSRNLVTERCHKEANDLCD